MNGGGGVDWGHLKGVRNAANKKNDTCPTQQRKTEGDSKASPKTLRVWVGKVK